MEWIKLYLAGTAATYPILLVHLVGLALSIFLRSRLSRGWWAAALAFIIFIVGDAGFLIFYVIYTSEIMGLRDLELIGRLTTIQSVFHAITSFFAYILLMVALFIRRDPQ